MSALERRYRALLSLLPAAYRREREDEILDTLLEAAEPGQRWPDVRQVGSIVMLGWRLRAAASTRADVDLRDSGAGPTATVGLLLLAVLAVSRLETWWRTGWVLVPDWLGGASMVAWLLQQFGWILAFVALCAGHRRLGKTLAVAAAAIAVLLVGVDVLLASRWYVTGQHLGLAFAGVVTASAVARVRGARRGRWLVLAGGAILAVLAVAAPDGVVASGGRVGLSSPTGASFEFSQDVVLNSLPVAWMVALIGAAVALPLDRRPAAVVLFMSPAAIGLAMGQYPIGVSEFSGVAGRPPVTAVMFAGATLVLALAVRFIRRSNDIPPAPPPVHG